MQQESLYQAVPAMKALLAEVFFDPTFKTENIAQQLLELNPGAHFFTGSKLNTRMRTPNT